ncbi:hypothetical protein [Streptomyces broussonetiae]|uniref:hypothetical protein n=1 Tax=Streptomyces broussonetiae TaxID=2686304 RepID=UPI0018EED800|nr:hypothetical protein [Streptomyces broussonetiae]
MTTQRSETSATSTDATPTVARQPDGYGKRVGEVAEITVLFDAKPGGAEKCRQNAAKIQADTLVLLAHLPAQPLQLSTFALSEPAA